MVDSLNQILTLITDYILYPFYGVDKLWGLLFLSVLGGVLLLLCYGKVSNQKAIKRVKRSIMASLFESVLYRQNLRLCLKAQWKMLLGGIKYFAIAIPPILVLMIPCVLMLAQMNLRYESNGLIVGKSALLKVKVEQAEKIDDIDLKYSENVDVTPRLRDLENKEVVWRLTPKDENNIDVAVVVAGTSEEYKQIIVVNDPSAKHLKSHFVKNPFEALLYPGNKRISNDSVISEIVVEYPGVSYKWLGINWHWLVLFLVVSIISGLIASKVFGVSV